MVLNLGEFPVEKNLNIMLMTLHVHPKCLSKYKLVGGIELCTCRWSKALYNSRLTVCLPHMCCMVCA